ncbi:hypothetical protein D1872_339520 [compost metagenome]
MSVNIDMKLAPLDLTVAHIAFYLEQVDTVRSETSQRFVECRGNIAHLEQQRGDVGFLSIIRRDRFMT